MLLVLGTLLSTQSFAQDTVRYGDPWYLFQPMPGTLAPPPDSLFFFNDPAHHIRPETYAKPFNSDGDSIIVYGIAYTSVPCEVPFYQPRCSIYESGKSLGEDGYVKTFFEVTNDSNIRQSFFEYEFTDGTSFLADFHEYLFQQPYPVCKKFFITLGETSVRNSDGWCLPYYAFDPSLSQRLYSPHTLDSITLEVSVDHVDTTEAAIFASVPQLFGVWGCIFPIVQLRCSAPRWERVEPLPGSVDLAWHGHSEAERYELRYGPASIPPDDLQGGLLTTDTALNLSGISDFAATAFHLRKQCAYTTVAYDTLVWSPWATVSGADLAARAAERRAGFALRPNPAASSTQLLLPAPCDTPRRVALLDMQGRRLLDTTLPSGSDRIDLDLSHLPSGLYMVSLDGGTPLKLLVTGGQ